jgi:hypothetical protein
VQQAAVNLEGLAHSSSSSGLDGYALDQAQAVTHVDSTGCDTVPGLQQQQQQRAPVDALKDAALHARMAQQQAQQQQQQQRRLPGRAPSQALLAAQRLDSAYQALNGAQEAEATTLLTQV